MARRRIAQDANDAAHRIPRVPQQVRGAGGARQINNPLQVRRAAGPEFPRQMLSRHAQRRGDMARLRGRARAAQHLLPRGELEPIGETQEPGRIRQRASSSDLGGAGGNPLARDGVIDAFDENTSEPGITARREEGAIIRPYR